MARIVSLLDPPMNDSEEMQSSKILVLNDLFMGSLNTAGHDDDKGSSFAMDDNLLDILEWPPNYCEWSELLSKSVDHELFINIDENMGMKQSNIEILHENYDMSDVFSCSRAGRNGNGDGVMKCSSLWDANCSSKCMDMEEDEVAFARSCITVLNQNSPNHCLPSRGTSASNAKLIMPVQAHDHNISDYTSYYVSGEIGYGRENECEGAMARTKKSRSAHHMKGTCGAVPLKLSSESSGRKQLTRLFCSLRALFPSQLIPQNDKCKLIDHTCQYIGELENKIKRLRIKSKILKRMNGNKQRQQRQRQLLSISLYRDRIIHFQVSSSCGGKFVNISLGCYRALLSFSTLLRILDMQGLDILSANCSLSHDTTLYAIHSTVKDPKSSFSSLDMEKLRVELNSHT